MDNLYQFLYIIEEEDDYLQIKDAPMVSMEMVINKMITNSETSTTTNPSQNKLAISKPLILKPVAVVNGSTSNSNIQSHIKIGDNIFAIIQKSNPTSLTVSSKTDILAKVERVSKSEANTTLKICQPGVEVNKNSKLSSSFHDHDYVEDEEFTESVGVSKVNIIFFIVYSFKSIFSCNFFIVYSLRWFFNCNFIFNTLFILFTPGLWTRSDPDR